MSKDTHLMSRDDHPLASRSSLRANVRGAVRVAWQCFRVNISCTLRVVFNRVWRCRLEKQSWELKSLEWQKV